VQATPAQTVDDVLRTVPGVDIPFENAVVAHPTSNFISMRGLGGIRTLVLLDGAPVNDPFFGYVQWNKVPMEVVDRIEVVRGGSSSLYGTYALGGVINFITRQPDASSAELSASYGTNSTGRINLFASHSVAPGLRLTFNGNYFNTDGYLRPFPEQLGPLDINGRGEAQNAYLRADYAPSEHWSTFVRTNLYRLQQNQGSPLGQDGQHTWDLATGFRHRAANGGSLNGTVFYQRDRAWTHNTDPITQRGVDEFLSNVHSTPAHDIGASIQWSQPVTSAGMVLTAGADARAFGGEDQSDNYSAPGQFAFHEIGGGTQQTLGLFGQVDWFATDRLELLASARLDYWRNVNGHDDKTPGESKDFPDKTKARVNPKLSARYRLAEPLTLRGTFYQAFNAPNLDQLYRPYSAQNYANVANSQLDPETLTGGELGLDYAHAGLSLQANVFQSTLRDVITYAAIAFDPVHTTTPVNLGRARSQGAEVFGDWEPVEGWHVGASYTYTESVITDNPADPALVGKMNPDTPRHEIAGTLGYQRSDRPSVFLRGRYLSRRFTDATNARELEGHFVLEASASYGVLDGLVLFAEAQNLFNKLYVASSYGFDARGTPRQVFVGLRSNLLEVGR
jgi:outer membrane receptor protein involved in Fe transport